MLVLTRRINEEILIGDEIEIRILSMRGQSVSIGITAPQTLRVLRSELSEASEVREEIVAR